MGVIVPSAPAFTPRPAPLPARIMTSASRSLPPCARRPHPFLASLPSQALPGLYLPLPFPENRNERGVKIAFEIVSLR